MALLIILPWRPYSVTYTVCTLLFEAITYALPGLRARNIDATFCGGVLEKHMEQEIFFWPCLEDIICCFIISQELRMVPWLIELCKCLMNE